MLVVVVMEGRTGGSSRKERRAVVLLVVTERYVRWTVVVDGVGGEESRSTYHADGGEVEGRIVLMVKKTDNLS